MVAANQIARETIMDIELVTEGLAFPKARSPWPTVR